MNSNKCTKMCYAMYVGCTNEECTFAHTEKECRAKSMSAAMQGVKFIMPENMPVPQGMSFIVRLRDSDIDDEDDEEDEEEYPQASMSLSGLTKAMYTPQYSLQKAEWLSQQFIQAKLKRGIFMARCAAKKSSPSGEDDMDLSE